ncbi:hypothetical protein B296_00016519 [Ensete ventricosum]|uniref:Uncharacterized protein n=1 Tax=Ensete ventricosum TaxID=4639 RepID=A0A426Z320_ENSVE|nr:hypothetical protein B296_00016519 [Ensete ventricosum]
MVTRIESTRLVCFLNCSFCCQFFLTSAEYSTHITSKQKLEMNSGAQVLELFWCMDIVKRQSEEYDTTGSVMTPSATYSFRSTSSR